MCDKDTNVPNKNDCIRREIAKAILHKRAMETALNNAGYQCDAGVVFQDASHRLKVWLDEVPTADVVEVVRCKDCIHAPLPGDCEGGSNMEWPKIDGIYEDCTCPHFCDDDWYSARPDPEGFCEKGERREPNLDTTKGDNHGR